MYIESDDSTAKDEKLMYFEYLNELGYFNKSSNKLTAKGWTRIAELTSKQNEINQDFIAMQFDEETESISDSFKKAIDANGRFRCFLKLAGLCGQIGCFKFLYQYFRNGV